MPEEQTHSFVIRFWLEEKDSESGQGIWRGHITHIASGARCYLKELNEVIAFIAPYLEGMEVKLSIRWRARQWLKKLLQG